MRSLETSLLTPYTYRSKYSFLTIFDTNILKFVEDVFYGTKGLKSIVLIDFRRPWLHKKFVKKGF